MNDMVIPSGVVYKTTKGLTVTDSVKVAEVFGKQHKNVLKSIRKLVTCNADLGQLFRETSYRDANGKSQPMFVITRRGFSLMVRNGLSGEQLALRDAIARALEDDGQAVPPPAVNDTPVDTPDIGRVFTINANEIGRCVDARQLHSFLGVQRDFSTWFKYRVEQYGLVEGQDYTAISDHKFVESLSQAHRIEYAITIDTAKELAMVEGNERGKLARRYFIEVERRYKAAVSTPAIPQTFAQALRLAAEQAETIEAQQKQLAAQAPKVAFATAIINSPSSCGIDELAKLLRQNGIDMGEIRLFKWLRDNGYLCNVGTARNQPTQKALDMGLFELKPQTWTNPKTDEVMTTTRTMVTGKGKEYFINKFLFKQQKGQGV